MRSAQCAFAHPADAVALRNKASIEQNGQASCVASACCGAERCCCEANNIKRLPASFLQAALFRLDGSNLTQQTVQGEFSDVNSASCNNFVWLRNGSQVDAANARLAASCFLKGPGRTVVRLWLDTAAYAAGYCLCM